MTLTTFATLAIGQRESCQLLVQRIVIADTLVKSEVEAIGFIDTHVAVSTERGIARSSETHLEFHVLLDVLTFDVPDATGRRYLEGIGSNQDIRLCAGLLTHFLGERDDIITTHAIVNGLYLRMFNVETNISTHIGHIQTELWLVGSLQSGSFTTPIQGTGETVLTIDANDAILLWPILQVTRLQQLVG